MRTVLITGAGGFLGGHLAPAFTEMGWRCVGIGRSDADRQSDRFASFHLNDMANPDRVLSVVDRYRPDVAVHLAAPASVPQSLRTPVADLHAHIDPTVNLLESVRISGLPVRVVLVSSAAVYGNPVELPVGETAPAAPISPYGFHKLHQELILDEYAAIHGVRGCKVRVFSTYGENLRRLAVWDIARRALRGDCDVFGTGSETRDYLYVADVATAIVKVAEAADFAGETINIGSGVEVSIRELAGRIFQLTGTGLEPRFTGERLAGSPDRWRAGVSRLQALGWKAPEWSRGLAKTCEWIRSSV